MRKLKITDPQCMRNGFNKVVGVGKTVDERVCVQGERQRHVEDPSQAAL